MINFINKNKLLATTAICAISICANTVKAEEISISEILNNSTTKSPNISWEEVTTAGENTIQIGDKYFKYTWTNKDAAWGKYTERQENTLSGDVVGDFIGVEYETSSDAYGGAVYNGGSIESITGNFINNSINHTGNNCVYGGVIYNASTVDNIKGDFINNSIDTSSENQNRGGSIYNSGTISSIIGNFIGNSINSTGLTSTTITAIFC